MKRIIYSILGLLLLPGCVSASNPTFLGKWYGNSYGCRMTVEFTPDSIMKVSSEANSQMEMSSPFTVAPQGNRFDIDLNNPQGLSALGIADFNDPDHLNIALAFKFGEYGQRPGSFEEVAGNPAAMLFKLTRKPEEVTSKLDAKIDAPACAQLAFERNRRLGRGLCLNGCVDANPDDGNDDPLYEDDFRQIAAAGFQSLRVPITWVKHCAKEAPYTIDPDFFAYIDWIIEQAFKNNLAVSIDQHYYPYINMGDDDPDLTWEQNIDRIKSFWTQISEHYKDYSNDMLFFDLLNEPNMRIGAEGLNNLHADLIKIVRKTNPDRTIIIGTPNLGQTWTLGELEFPEDEWNIIVQAHYYLPHTFTHQNLSYLPQAYSPTVVPWNGTEMDKWPIERDLNFCHRWSECNCRPVNIGEYGVCLNAEQDSRSRYLAFMQDQFNKHGFSSHLCGGIVEYSVSMTIKTRYGTKSLWVPLTQQTATKW